MPGPGVCPLGVVPALGAGARVSQYFRLGLRFGDCELCFCSSCRGDDGRSWRLGGRERRRRCRPIRFPSLFFGSVELRAFGWPRDSSELRGDLLRLRLRLGDRAGDFDLCWSFADLTGELQRGELERLHS